MKIRFNLNLKPVLLYTSLVLVSSLLISLILIALPLTEKITPKLSFNLTTKDSKYWSKEYFLKVESTEKKEIQQMREILYKRLRNYGVEKVTVYQEKGDEQSSKLRIVVNTTKDEKFVSELIGNRFYFQIVTRKDDVNFEDVENPYAYLMGENYNATDWDSFDFRGIYITKLRSGDGTYNNFAIFKQWPKQEKEFKTFLQGYVGQTIGVNIDGFVTPYQVPETINDPRRPEIFAIPVFTEERENLKVVDLLYNSGHIIPKYTVENEEQINPQVISLNYIKIGMGLAISIITAYLYLLIFNYSTGNNLLKSFVTTVITISAYISYLKLLHIPVDTFILTIQIILTVIFIRGIVENKDSEVHLTVALIGIFSIIAFLGTGFMMTLSTGMITLVVLSNLCLILTNWYIDKLKRL